MLHDHAEPTATPDSPAKRRQRRRGFLGGDARLCPHCGRSFKRTEHLERHVRTHTKEKPFVCACGAAFARRDLLTRHQRITLHEGEATQHPSEDAESRTESGSGSGDGDMEHAVSEASRRDAPVLEPHPDLAAAISLSDLSVDWSHQMQPAQMYPASGLPEARQLTAYPVDAPFQPNVSLPPEQFMNDDNQEPGDEFMDAQFREFATFLDGMGMPAEWSPYFYSGPGEEAGHCSQGRSVTSRATTPLGADRSRPRTPFTSWLPSAPAGNRVSAALQGLASRAPDFNPLRVTEDHRARLSTTLEEFHAILPDPDFKMPSRHALTRYISSFFEGFHSHMPFIHLPTWRILNHSLELILGISAIGAQYCFEHRNAARMFFAGKAIALHKLQGRATPFAGLDSHASTFTDDEKTEMIRAIVTLMGFATWEIDVDLLREAFSLQILLAQLLRESDLSEPQNDIITGADDKAWQEWVARESTRRSKLIAFSFLHTHSIAYDVYPVLRSNEIALQLPCSTPEWKAASATAWIAARTHVPKQQLFFQEALSTLLRNPDPSSPPQPLDPIPTPLGNYLLLHGLLQRIHILRDLALPHNSTPTDLPPDEVDRLERGLRAWTAGWQQAPESSLDPNNDNGPIPFTSSSLVGLAYARIHCPLGPRRRLETRDPALISAALASAPDVRRGESVVSALLYAAHMLSIPVRLGVDRVARSQAFFWSVRHSLSGLECAVLLCKWLMTISAGTGPPLTDSEDRIVNWVRFIVEEAYAVVDFDGEDGEVKTPAILGLDVLRIWAHFFKSNSQWPFINLIGQSLEKYREVLMSPCDVRAADAH